MTCPFLRPCPDCQDPAVQPYRGWRTVFRLSRLAGPKPAFQFLKFPEEAAQLTAFGQPLLYKGLSAPEIDPVGASCMGP